MTSPSPACFRLAPMSGPIRALTPILLFLPIVFFLLPVHAGPGPSMPFLGLLLGLMYGVIWCFMRPREFLVRADGIEIVWPLRRRWIPRANIASAEEICREDLRRELGSLLRFGAGGVWGGFGLALSSKGQHLSLLVSRDRDGLVLLRCRNTRSILMTPERPAEFVSSVRALLSGS